VTKTKRILREGLVDNNSNGEAIHLRSVAWYCATITKYCRYLVATMTTMSTVLPDSDYGHYPQYFGGQLKVSLSSLLLSFNAG
jgi:hypothetical protein